MTREEFLTWARRRALEEFDWHAEYSPARDPYLQGLTSLASDLRKHPETADLQVLTDQALLDYITQRPRTRAELITLLDRVCAPLTTSKLT